MQSYRENGFTSLRGNCNAIYACLGFLDRGRPARMQFGWKRRLTCGWDARDPGNDAVH